MTDNNPRYYKGKTGSEHPCSKAVEQIDAEGNVVAEFETQSAAAAALGVPQSNISRAIDRGYLVNGHRIRPKHRQPDMSPA